MCQKKIDMLLDSVDMSLESVSKTCCWCTYRLTGSVDMSLKSVSKTCKLAVFLYIFYKYMVYQSNQKIYASSLPPLSDLFRESD